MYLPGCGSCSSVLHLIAKHPKITLAIGLVAVVSYLVSPVGPGAHAGSGGILEGKEIALLNEMPELKANAEAAMAAFKEVENAPLTDADINYVLNKILECRDLTPADIKRDPQIMRKVSLLYFLNLAHNSGIDGAKQVFLSK